MKLLTVAMALMMGIMFTSPESLDIRNNSNKAVETVFYDSFENGLNDGWMPEMANEIYSGTFSSKYAREGSYSYRIELRSDDHEVFNGKRSEISIMEPEPAAAERIYQCSVFLPQGGEEDYALDPEGDETIVQWHNTPDPGEKGTYPPLALHTRWNGRYILTRCWDADPMSSEEKMLQEGTMSRYDLGSYIEDKGKWVDWTFHVKWGWHVSQHPMIDIYKNGVKIFQQRDEPNTTNDKQGIRMQIGIYKWEWGQAYDINKSILTERVIYYDRVSISKIN